MPKITPFLWFDTQAEEAARFYVSVFKDSGIRGISHYGPGMHLPEGTVMTVEFTLNGEPFTAMNGGPMYTFNPAISFVVHCDSQAELDEVWARLTEGGAEVQCGWLTDRYGLSWQVVPRKLLELLTSGDPAAVNRVMQAVMRMVKLDQAELERAFRGEA